MIALHNVSKRYTTARRRIAAVENISLAFEPGSITAVFGPNGSGKSTVLGMLTGLIEPDEGRVDFDERRSSIGVVFQDFRSSLLPWLTLRGNILRPSAWLGQSTDDAAERLQQLLSVFAIALPLEQYPHQVSGGQAQIACLLRALVIQPRILVLDEPTSALDFTLQWQTVLQLQHLWINEGITIIMVSHDPEQAVLVSDRVVVMGANPGRVIDVIDITLPRPRTFEMTRTSAFLEFRDRVLSAFVGIQDSQHASQSPKLHA